MITCLLLALGFAVLWIIFRVLGIVLKITFTLLKWAFLPALVIIGIAALFLLDLTLAAPLLLILLLIGLLMPNKRKAV